jgi:hypothetical protein
VVEWDVRTGTVIAAWPRPEEPWRLEALLDPRRQVFARHDETRTQVIVHDLPSGKEL